MSEAQWMTRVSKTFFIQTFDVSQKMMKTGFQKMNDIGRARGEMRSEYDEREIIDEKHIIRFFQNS